MKKGDTVAVLVGADKGKKAKILKIFPKTGTVLLEGINLKKKHQRPRQQGKKGQVIDIAHPIHFSNVAPSDAPKKKAKKA